MNQELEFSEDMCPSCQEASFHFLLSTIDTALIDPEEFINTCHNPPGTGGGRFCSGPGSQAARLRRERGRRDSDGLVGKVRKEDIPKKRGLRSGSLVDPNEGTRTVDGVKGYNDKGKPVPGSDAWLEAHGISKELFASRPYAKYEGGDKEEPALLEAVQIESDRGNPKARNLFINKGAEQEGQETGGYIMYKEDIPGTPIEDPVPWQARPNVALITDPSKRAQAKAILDNAKSRKEALENMSKSDWVKEKKEGVKQAELNLERVKKATPEKIKAEANERVDSAKESLKAAKASENADRIKTATAELGKAKRDKIKADRTAGEWDLVRKEQFLHDANVRLENAKQSLENAQTDPERSISSALRAAKNKVKRAENRFEKSAAKYVFTPGASSSRIEMHPDAQNRKNLTEGKGRIYFAMEGSIKNDAILAAVKREDPTAAVVNVPSVTLWQKKDGVPEEVMWFAGKYGKDREIVLIPDADGVSNKLVVQQAEGLKTILENNGAGKVFVASPPLKAGSNSLVDAFNLPSGLGEKRKGVDDHLGAGRGTLGQLQFSASKELPKFNLSHLTKAGGAAKGERINSNAVENAERVLQSISGIAGPRGSAQIPKKLMAQTAGVAETTSSDARSLLSRMGIIEVEHIYDPVGAQRFRKQKNPNISYERIETLVKRGVISEPNWDDPFMDIDIDYSPVVTIRDPKYVIKASDVETGSLSDLPSWKPPKSFDGWRSPITGKKDTTGIAKQVQKAADVNSVRNRKLSASKPIQKVEAPTGRRIVRTPEGAKRYGVPVGSVIPLSGDIVSLTMGSMDIRSAPTEIPSPSITQFYNRCNDSETGRFCEGEDGPGRKRDNVKGKSSGGSWPSKTGRKITKREPSKGDPVKSQAVYETETSNGKKVRLYDQTGEAGSQAENLLNNHARLNEMYDLGKTRDLIVTSPTSLFSKTPIDSDDDVSVVNSRSPYTYINSNNLDYDTKDFRTGWGMHSSQTGNTKNLDYIMTHEFGHHVDYSRNSFSRDGQDVHKPNPLFSNKAVRGTLSRYGRENDMEAYAETFAEWHHTNGKTRNPASVAMARDQKWFGYEEAGK